MSPIERLTPRPALHQQRVDFPVSANTVHRIKTAWIFRNCGIASLHHCIKTAWIFRAAPTISTSYKLWQSQKNRVDRKISAGEARELHRHGAHGFRLGASCRSRDCTHHRTAVIIIGSSTAGLRPEEREMEIDTDIITPRRTDCRQFEEGDHTP